MIYAFSAYAKAPQAGLVREPAREFCDVWAHGANALFTCMSEFISQ
jgi:hypothetical protein